MKKTILICFLYCYGLGLATLNAQYSVESIPIQLMLNSDAVVREYRTDYEVVDKGKAHYTKHLVVTILNDKGEELYSKVYFDYSNLSKIDDLSARYYDGSGKNKEKISKSDILDRGYNTGNFVDDSRFKVLSFPHQNFPYTVEYEIEYIEYALLNFPKWVPQTYTNVSVQHSEFNIKSPNDLPVRYKVLGKTKLTFEEKAQSNSKTLHWECSNLGAFELEPYAANILDRVPMVITGPTFFEMEGYVGCMDSWSNFGLFFNHLNNSRSELPKETVEMLHKLVADCTDDRCKVEKIYTYLQNTTRYVSIQLGIGGYQPTPAEEVDEKKYGDCKGLNNYMEAMLHAVGVNSHYVIVHAGQSNPKVWEDFPANYFNHIITCVPLQKDTIWLECTSQSDPCGYLGDFTCDRNALLVSPQGGKLIHTPSYNETVNKLSRKGEIKLLSNGEMDLEVQSTYTGISEEFAEHLATLSTDEQKKYLFEILDMSNYDIKEVYYRKKGKSIIPEAESKLALKLRNWSTKGGNRFFFQPNVLSRFTNNLNTDTVRTFDIQLEKYGYTFEDSILVTLPQGYSLEGKFTPVNIESPFGSFFVEVTNENGQIWYHRKLIVNNKIMPPDAYPQLVDFIKTIVKSDKTKLVAVIKA